MRAVSTETCTRRRKWATRPAGSSANQALGSLTMPLSPVARHLQAVDGPFQRRAPVDRVVMRLRRDAVEADVPVDVQHGAVGLAARPAPLHALAVQQVGVGRRLWNVGTGRRAADFHLQAVFRAGFVAEVQRGQTLAGAAEGIEVRREGDARQVFRQIRAVLFAVIGRVQQAVNVVPDIVLRDALLGIAIAELRQSPVGEVVDAAVTGHSAVVARVTRDDRQHGRLRVVEAFVAVTREPLGL